ncbi:MAG: hypothetical protein AAFP84_19835, partial [Actinomycetota bacterium]
MRSRLALHCQDANRLIEALAGHVETAAIGRGRLTRSDDDHTVVVTDITFVADDGYLERSATHLTLRPEGWSPACRQISLAGDVPV